MMKQFKKVVSILCIIALLVSGIAMAYADEAPAGETVTAAEDNSAKEEAARKAEEEAARKAAEKEAARKAEEEAARKAAEQEAARKAAEQEAARKAAEEEAARKAAEEEAARKAAEEEAARQPAEEETAPQVSEEETAGQPAEEEPSNTTEETPKADAAGAGEDGLVEIDDGWGYVDPEVISENTPEITDELKGLRRVDMKAGESLSDTVSFGDELVITLKCGKADTVDLKLYSEPGADIHVKVDGKAAGFTPADSDSASKALSVFTLTNTSGRTHEIVLSSSDTASFKLVAEVKQTEVQDETPETENNVSAEDKPAEKPAESQPAAEPTVQASVKTYDALKVGNRISDTLYAGQKAKIQLKCGKNPFVTLTLNANPDDLNVQIDGNKANFTRTAGGTYTCEFENVAFRKFNVTISAKQDLAFTLSAAANTEAAEKAAAEKEQEETPVNTNKIEETETAAPAESEPAADTTEEPAADTAEEPAGETEKVTGEEPSEEPAEEVTEAPAEAPAEGTEEEPAEGTEEEPAEGTEEEPTEGTEEEPAEGTEEEPAEGTEEEPAEGTEGDPAEGIEEETTEEEELAEEEPAETLTEEVVETFDVELPVMSSLESGFTPFGETCSVTADMTGYEEYDRIEVRWFSSADEGETWNEIEGAEGTVYDYVMSTSNWYYRFRAVATITVVTYKTVAAEDAEEQEPAGEETDEEAAVPAEEEPAASEEAAPSTDEEIVE